MDSAHSSQCTRLNSSSVRPVGLEFTSAELEVVPAELESRFSDICSYQKVMNTIRTESTYLIVVEVSTCRLTGIRVVNWTFQRNKEPRVLPSSGKYIDGNGHRCSRRMNTNRPFFASFQNKHGAKYGFVQCAREPCLLPWNIYLTKTNHF